MAETTEVQSFDTLLRTGPGYRAKGWKGDKRYPIVNVSSRNQCDMSASKKSRRLAWKQLAVTIGTSRRRMGRKEGTGCEAGEVQRGTPQENALLGGVREVPPAK